MEVNLKSNGWYNKIQAWTLGESKPDLFSLCPFFWLTIFCLMASPVTLVLKFFKGIFNIFEKQLQRKIDNWIASISMDEVIGLHNDTFQNKPFFYGKKLTTWGAYRRWKEYMMSTGLTKEEVDTKFDVAYIAWKLKSNERAEAARIENEKNAVARAKAEAKAAAKLQRRKNAWIPIVIWTKRVFNLALTIAIMAICTLLINVLVANFDGSATLEGLIFIGWGLLGLAVIVGIILAIRAYYHWCQENNKIPTVFKPFILIGVPIGKFFKWIGKGIGSGFGLFWEYFKANKNDYCPGINWDNEKTSK